MIPTSINPECNEYAQLEKNSPAKLFKRIQKEFLKYGKDPKNLLKKAFDLAEEVHKTQFRESGAPYLTHPLSVCIVLLSNQPDLETLIATILHDAIEDSTLPSTPQDILETFGEEVYQIIEGVSKVAKEYDNKQQNQQETIRKMMSYAQKDVRILLVKVADRIHNMTTISGKKSPEKRQKKAQETLQIFVPISQRLGLWHFKNLLEDLCFSQLFPLEFKDLQKATNKQKKLKQQVQKNLKKTIFSEPLKELVTDLKFKEYNLFEVFNEQEAENIEVDKLFYVQVVTKSEEDCYRFLSRIKKVASLRPEVFKDFIASPRDNGYRALHMTIIMEGNYLIRLHVMDEEMKLRNNLGVVLDVHKKEYQQDLLSKIDDLSDATIDKSDAFIQAIQKDVLSNKVLVHHKDVKDFYVPEKSTVLDVAFLMFPNKAAQLKEVKVNKSAKTYSTLVKNNDLLSFDFGKDSEAHLDWLQDLNTETARIRLQKHLKEQNRDYKIRLGEMILIREFDRFRQGEVYSRSIKQKTFLKQFKVETVDQLFILVSEGLLSPSEVIDKALQNGSKATKSLIFHRFVQKVLGFNKLQSKTMKLKCTGNSPENILESIESLKEEHPIVIKNLNMRSTPDGHAEAQLNLSAQRYQHLLDGFLQMMHHEKMTNVKLLTPKNIQIRLSGLIGTTALLWIAFFWTLLTHQLDFINSFLYLGIIPMLLMNYWIYHFVAHYFPAIRKSRWFIASAFVINALAIALYSSSFLILEANIFQFSFFFPLTILVFSLVALISIVVEKDSLYKHAESRKPISDKEWQLKKKEKIKGYLIRFGAVIIWGLEPLYIKYTVTNSIDPGLRVVLKEFGGLIPSVLFGALLFGYFSRKKISWKLPLNKVFAIIIIGELLFTYLLNASLVYTSSTNVILLNNFSPVFALIIAALLWRHEIPYLQKRSNIVAIFFTFIIGSLGSTLLFYNDIKFASQLEVYGDFLATLTMAVDVFLVIAMIRYVQKLRGAQSILLNFYIFFFSLMVSAPLVLIFSEYSLFDLTQNQLLFGIGAGVLSGVGRILNFEAFRIIDGYLAYLMFNISIFVTFVVEAFILNAIPSTSLLLLGGSLIIGSSTIAEYINSQSEKSGYNADVK